jgi:hypothetical protein
MIITPHSGLKLVGAFALKGRNNRSPGQRPGRVMVAAGLPLLFVAQ